VPSVFQIQISGLTSARTYYFKAKAVGNGTISGTEVSFTTP
jgi:hypothetical protein